MGYAGMGGYGSMGYGGMGYGGMGYGSLGMGGYGGMGSSSAYHDQRTRNGSTAHEMEILLQYPQCLVLYFDRKEKATLELELNKAELLYTDKVSSTSSRSADSLYVIVRNKKEFETLFNFT